jgi:hypothetical protein
MSTTVGTLKLVRSYPSKTDGAPVFVYEVSGNKKQQDAYEAAQGENFRKSDETGKPLFFAKRAVPNGTVLEISSNGSVFANTTNLAAAASMVGTLAGSNKVLETALANAYAEKVMGQMFGGRTLSNDTPSNDPGIQDAGPQDHNLGDEESEEEKIARELAAAQGVPAGDVPADEKP